MAMKKITIWHALGAIGLVTLLACSSGGRNDTPPPTPPWVQGGTSGPAPAVEIDLAEFNRLRDGMTYDEVTAIVGSKGTLSTSSGPIAIYGFKGDVVGIANAQLTFTNGVLTGRSQVGLR